MFGGDTLGHRAAPTGQWLVAHRVPLVQPSFAGAGPLPSQGLRDDFGVRAQVLAPLVLDDTTIGWVSCHSTREPRGATTTSPRLRARPPISLRSWRPRTPRGGAVRRLTATRRHRPAPPLELGGEQPRRHPRRFAPARRRAGRRRSPARTTARCRRSPSSPCSRRSMSVDASSRVDLPPAWRCVSPNSPRASRKSACPAFTTSESRYWICRGGGRPRLLTEGMVGSRHNAAARRQHRRRAGDGNEPRFFSLGTRSRVFRSTNSSRFCLSFRVSPCP